MAEVLLDAMIKAPLVGADPAAPNVFHAITMEAVIAGWPDGPLTGACGATGLLLPDAGGGRSVLWPPRVASLPAHITRCRACQQATGNKRPRSTFKAKATTAVPA